MAKLYDQFINFTSEKRRDSPSTMKHGNWRKLPRTASQRQDEQKWQEFLTSRGAASRTPLLFGLI